MSDLQMRNDRDNELSWDAFRYVAGEMSESEVAVFESRLSESQDAREAVAAVVELSQIVSLVAGETQPVRRRGREFRRIAGWMALGAAACFVLVAILGWGRTSGRRGGEGDSQVVRAANDDRFALAMAWTQLREGIKEELAESEAGYPAALWLDEVGAEMVVFDSTESAELDTELPEWLLFATAVEQSTETTDEKR